MCGRFTITVSWDELMLRFMLDPRPGKYQPRYNAAPGQWIPAIIGGDATMSMKPEGVNRFGELLWGLVPSWSGDAKSGARMMNARAETVAEKPSFRSLLERKRCLIPADGFYEWKPAGKSKQPYRFVKRSGGLFGMAALYDTWVSPDGSKLHTCTVITTEANALVAGVHPRMPVILQPESESKWLNRSIHSREELLPLLVPYPEEEMDCYEVDPKVGQVRWDEPACIDPLITLL